MKKILQATFCQYFIFYGLYIENFIRKNAFVFGIIVFFCLDFILTENLEGLKFNRLWIWIFYYILMCYIKIRVSLVNHTILNKKNENFISWEDFIVYYNIKNKIKKNYSFKHITALYNLLKKKSELSPSPTAKSNGSGALVFSNSICISMCSADYTINTSKTKQIEKKIHENSNLSNKANFILGFSLVAFLNLIFKKAFFKKKESALNFKEFVTERIKEGLRRLNDILEEAKLKEDLNLQLEIQRDLILWLKLKQKIEETSFLYFLTERSKEKAKWAAATASSYTGPSLERYKHLEQFYDTFNLINIFLSKNNEIPNQIIYSTDTAPPTNINLIQKFVAELE